MNEWMGSCSWSHTPQINVYYADDLLWPALFMYLHHLQSVGSSTSELHRIVTLSSLRASYIPMYIPHGQGWSNSPSQVIMLNATTLAMLMTVSFLSATSDLSQDLP